MNPRAMLVAGTVLSARGHLLAGDTEVKLAPIARPAIRAEPESTEFLSAFIRKHQRRTVRRNCLNDRILLRHFLCCKDKPLADGQDCHFIAFAVLRAYVYGQSLIKPTIDWNLYARQQTIHETKH